MGRAVKKTRIVYTINHIRKSGPNEVLKNMVKSIDPKRFDVTVISFMKDSNDQEVKELNSFGASHICLDLEQKIDIITKGPTVLRKVLKDIQPDIVHSHGILSDIASCKSGFKSKYVSTVHNNIFEDYRYTFGTLKGILFALWHLVILRKFDKVVGCSEAAYSAIKKYPPTSTFVRNGIGFTNNKDIRIKSNVRSNLGIGGNDIVYIYAGKLSKRKNILGLLNSFKSAHTEKEHLIIIGEGELRKECETYSNSNIHILGFKSNVADYLDISNIYISASNSEGFSISVIEALDRGLYILLSDIPSHREFFSIDKATYIGELFTAHDFETKKQQLLEHLPRKNQVVQFKEKYLSGRSMMKEYEAIYKEVLA